MAKATERNIMGATVVDQITGFKGTVTGIVYMLSGSVMGQVTPKVGKDGKMPETWAIDVDRLAVQRTGPMKPTQLDETSHIQLGATARDRVTGVEGVLTEKAVYLNGCTHFIITAKTMKKDERAIAVDWKRLAIDSSTPVVAMQATRASAPGGPSRRVE